MRIKYGIAAIPRPSSKWFAACLAVQSIFFLVVIFQLKGFVLSDQILNTREMWADPASAYRFQNPHALRYLIIYPVFMAENITGLDRHYVYSIFVLAAYFGTVLVNGIVVDAEFCNSTRRHFYRFLVCVFYTCLFTAMSGRLPIAFFGYSLVVAAILLSGEADRLYLRTIGMSVFGILLCTITSGVFLSAILCLIGASAISVPLFRHRQKSARLLVTALVVLAVFNIQIPIIFMGSFSYFGDGVGALRGMFSHGYGAVILEVQEYPVLFIAILAFGVSVFFLIRRVELPARALNLALVTAIVICLGAFGYSTLLMALVPGLLLGLVILESAYNSILSELPKRSTE